MSARAISVLRQNGGASVVALRGEHDLSSAEELRAALGEASTTGDGVVVDLSDAIFIDSAVLSALIASHREVTSEGRGWAVVVGRGSGAAVRRIFELTGLDALMAVYEHADDAVSAMSSRHPQPASEV
jgi:anti-sigma B factor antagonist